MMIRRTQRSAPYEEIEHTADWSFRVRGDDLPDLFANAARALSAMEATSTTECALTREVRVEGLDRESLLVNWLNELLHLSHTRREAYSGFDFLELNDTHLRARIQGRSAADARRLIKAVTFHNLEVKRTGAGWEAMLVLDV